MASSAFPISTPWSDVDVRARRLGRELVMDVDSELETCSARWEHPLKTTIDVYSTHCVNHRSPQLISNSTSEYKRTNASRGAGFSRHMRALTATTTSRARQRVDRTLAVFHAIRLRSRFAIPETACSPTSQADRSSRCGPPRRRARPGQPHAPNSRPLVRPPRRSHAAPPVPRLVFRGRVRVPPARAPAPRLRADF